MSFWLARASEAPDAPPTPSPLWDHFEHIACPLLLIRGSLSPVVDDDDVAELLRRQPAATVVVVPDAGHSVQGDDPLRLAELIEGVLSPGG